VDFILGERNIVLRVMGTFWHSSLKSEARDSLGKEKLIERGYIVVDLWESNLEPPEKLEKTMQLALQGQEALR